MNTRFNLLEHPLNWVFSRTGSIAILRALLDSREGMSGRAAARAAGMNHQTCAVAVNRLEGLGVLKRQGSGKTQLIRLNAENLLVRDLLLPLLRGERDFFGRMKADISGWAGPKALCTVLFGSVARLEAEPGSDADLLLLASPAAKAALTAAADEFRRDFAPRYGIRLSPVILTVREALGRLKKGDPLIKNIMREGIDLGPAKLKEVLNDA